MKSFRLWLQPVRLSVPSIPLLLEPRELPFLSPHLPSPLPCPIPCLLLLDLPFSPLLPEIHRAHLRPALWPPSWLPEAMVQPQYPPTFKTFKQKWRPYASFPSPLLPLPILSFRWQSGCNNHPMSIVRLPLSSALASVHLTLIYERPPVAALFVLVQSSLLEWPLDVTSHYSNSVTSLAGRNLVAAQQAPVRPQSSPPMQSGPLAAQWP